MSCKGHEWKNSPEAQASLDAAEEEGGCQLAPEETPALSTQGSLAELCLFQDWYFLLEREVEALWEEDRQLVQQQAQFQMLETFYGQVEGIPGSFST